MNLKPILCISTMFKRNASFRIFQMLTSNGDKYFFATFGSRDKSYMMIFRLWQLALLDKVSLLRYWMNPT